MSRFTAFILLYFLQTILPPTTTQMHYDGAQIFPILKIAYKNFTFQDLLLDLRIKRVFI